MGRALALLLLLVGCSGISGVEKFSPSLVNDTTVPTSEFVAIGTSGTNNVDADGDLSTCWDLGTAATRTLAFAHSSASHRTLKVLTSLATADGSSAGGTAALSYSIDGGATFISIWSVSGKNGRPPTTDAIDLPASQDLGLVQVRYSATMPPLHFKGCEAWIEASPST